MFSYFFILYVFVKWYDNTVLHYIPEYTTDDYCNIRFGMIAQYYTV